MTRRAKGQKGQAIVLVTLALFAMAGLMGLAVDLGWSFYVRKTAQAAADAAALAAASAALVGSTLPYTCGGNMQCSPTPIGCAGAGGNLATGCMYAGQNGFTDGGRNGRQTVTVAANVSPNFPLTWNQTQGANVLRVEPEYWVTVRVTERIPQLFSAIMGNTEGTVSARATAALANTLIRGSLILLNRNGDRMAFGNGPEESGLNVKAQAAAQGGANIGIEALGGIRMASSCTGGSGACDGNWAGEVGGGTLIRAPWTHIRSVGAAGVQDLDPQTGDGRSGGWSWKSVPDAGTGGREYWDPMRNKAQPDVSTQMQTPCPLSDPVIDGSTTPKYLGPGNYYYIDGPNGGVQPIQFKGQVHFVANAAQPCVQSSGNHSASSFGEFYFWGGVKTASGASLTLDPGRYAFAGVTPDGGGKAGSLFDVSAGRVSIKGYGDVSSPSYPGQLFIFTKPGYSQKLDAQMTAAANAATTTTAADATAKLSALQFGQSGFKTGNSPSPENAIDLAGIDPQSTANIPADLKAQKYGKLLIWHDRRNSVVDYDENTGNIACGNNQDTCTQALTPNNSNVLYVQAAVNVKLRGIIYQPRGAYANVWAGAQYGVCPPGTDPNDPACGLALQIITGGIEIGGNGSVKLAPVNSTLTELTAALIE